MIFYRKLIRLCVTFVLFGLLFILCFAALTEARENKNKKNVVYSDFPIQSLSHKLLKNEKSINNSTKLICFYVFTNEFKPDIMNGLCTHINVGFFSFDRKNFSLLVTPDKEKLLSEILKLKETNLDLKVLISFGGAGESNFSSMIVNHSTRKQFIKNCMKFIKKFKIDGLDLDWEWPVISSGIQKEKVKFIQLLKETKEEFDRHKKKYILSIDVSSLQVVIELIYYIQYIPNYVDYINVMCYDYHFFTKLFPFTGHNAPLYSVSNFPFHSFSVNNSISFWLNNKVPKEKIILGLPTYGHTFELTFSKQHSLAAPAKGFGSVGQKGFATYRQICEFLRQRNTTIVYDNDSKVPYAYLFPEWVSYDDENSLAIKASYILERKLGGAMVFSVNSDDFDGTYSKNGVSLPLIRKIRSILFNEA